MKRLLTITPAVAAIGVLAVAMVLMTMQSSPRADAAGTGPQIEIGATSLVAGKVDVPIITTGSGFTAYSGFSIHLRWDPGVFSFSSADITGSVIPGSPFCPAANTATYDSDGGGVVFGCSGLSGTTSSTGLLATIILTPAGSGCSALHLFTFGAPDGGTTGSGTYTNNPTTQTNTYLDGTSDVAGAACSPGVLTPTNTPTATPTETPGAAASATNTPFGGLRTVTPTPTPPVSATPVPPTEAPPTGETPAAPGGGSAPGGGGQPGGAPGGVISGPNTGTGATAGGGGSWLAVLLISMLGLTAGGSGLMFAGLRRRGSR